MTRSDGFFEETSPQIPLFILIAGPPCTGKTTLARALADRFHLPLFHKDGFKERMYDAACPDGEYEEVVTREFSRLLEQFSMEGLELSMEQCARCGISAIFESNFDSRLFSPRLSALRRRYPFSAVQANLRCRGDILLERFVARENSDRRHPGHCGLRHLDDLSRKLLAGAAEPLRMEPGDTLIEINTTDLKAVNYMPLVEAISGRLFQRAG